MTSLLPAQAAPGYQRILVVDDDRAILDLVRLKLEQGGFLVWTAASGEEALSTIDSRGLPHLAIVDITMPGMSGFDFCEAVQRFSDLPVILLTAVDREEMIIRGIEHFAEDYVVKPFSTGELLARVRRVLRRIGDFGYALDPVVRVDDGLAVNFSRQEALAAGNVVRLSPKEAKLLYILMRNRGRPVTTQFLLDRLWPLEEVFEDALRVHVHRLRRKIEADPAKPHYVVTVRKLGYAFLPATTSP